MGTCRGLSSGLAAIAQATQRSLEALLSEVEQDAPGSFLQKLLDLAMTVPYRRHLPHGLCSVCRTPLVVPCILDDMVIINTSNLKQASQTTEDKWLKLWLPL